MTWRVRPSARRFAERNRQFQACRTDSRDKLLTDARDTRTAGVQRQCVRSAIFSHAFFFISEFLFGLLSKFFNLLYRLRRVCYILVRYVMLCYVH